MKNFLLELKDISYVNEKNLILNKINFKINLGDKIALLGKSGSGKTTLISILNGTIVPQPVPAPAQPVKTEPDSVDEEVFDNIKDLKEKLGEVKDFTKFLETATEEMHTKVVGGQDDSEEG